MARNRMIKPEFWEDDKIGECSPTARLLFIALWNFADDEGYIEYRLKWIKAKVFPYDTLEIAPLLDELIASGRLERRGDILWVVHFLDHQKIERPRASDLSQLFKNSPTPHRIFTDTSPTKREEKLKEVKRKEVNNSPSENEAEPQPPEKDLKNSSLPDESPSPEVPAAPLPQHGKKEINEILLAIKGKVGIDDFADSQQWQRIYGKHCLNLMGKIGAPEFSRRLEVLMSDNFKAKRLNEIRFVYEQVKGFIEPKSNIAFIS